jgi:hypothetical protein
LHSNKWRYGKKKARNHTPQKKNYSIQNSVRNVENGYPVPDPKKTMINVTKKHSVTHIKTPKRRNLGRYH